MTIAWPLDIIARDCEFYLQANTRGYVSPITRTRQAIRGQGARWMARYTFRVVGRAGRARMDALLDQGKGSFENFGMWDHDATEPVGPNLDRTSLPITYFYAAGSPGGITSFTEGSPAALTGFSGGAAGITVRGGWSIRSTSIVAAGFPGNTTQLFAGDYVGIGGYLYRLVEDADANNVGRATLQLNRGLVSAAAHRDVITRTRASTPMYLADDDQSRRTATPDHVYDYSLTFVECLTP